ncbi:MAG: alpha/beta fold hydrolase, partial [Candidatus Helarchaeales archaeon]
DEFIKKKNLDSVSLVGHSLGGMVCQQLALLNPEKIRKMVLVGTSPRFDNPPPKEFLDFVRCTDIPTLIKMTSRFASIPLEKLPETQRKHYEKLKKWSIQRRCRSISKEAYIKFMNLTEKKKFNIVDELPKICIPTLITCGRLDKLIRVQNSRLIHEKIPNSQLYFFENCGHAPPREYPDEFNRLLLEFLKDC